MNPRRAALARAMQNTEIDILYEAIARNAAIVFSLPSAGMMRHCKSRFLGEEGQSFWVEADPVQRPLIDQLIAAQQPVGVSFKSGATKVVFLTQIIRREQEHRLNADTAVEAALLQFPDEVKAVQRRNNYRVQVRRDGDLRARLWRIGDKVALRDRPMAAQELSCEVRNISVGGLGVVLHGKDGQPPRITPDDRLRIEIQFREMALLLEGRMVYPPKAPVGAPSFQAGIQFKALQDDLDGRQMLAKLTRIVGELQREEVRHFWLGLGKSA